MRNPLVKNPQTPSAEKAAPADVHRTALQPSGSRRPLFGALHDQKASTEKARQVHPARAAGMRQQDHQKADGAGGFNSEGRRPRQQAEATEYRSIKT